MDRRKFFKILVAAAGGIGGAYLLLRSGLSGTESTTVTTTVTEVITKGPEQVVSVWRDPSLNGYPHSSKTPYGPDESRVYGAVVGALKQLNPNSDNPLADIISPGDTVALKPNLVSPWNFGDSSCTHTSIYRPIIDYAIKAGARKVTICEGPADGDEKDEMFGAKYTNISKFVDQMKELHPDVEIGWVNANKDGFIWFPLHSDSELWGVFSEDELFTDRGRSLKRDSYYYAEDSLGYNPKGYKVGLYAVAESVVKSDVLVNLPKMKTHNIAGATLSLKNLIGITPSATGGRSVGEDPVEDDPAKDLPHFSTPPPHWNGDILANQNSFENDALWRVIADLNKIALYGGGDGKLHQERQRRYLSVVDGIVAMEGNGPVNGKRRPMGTIVAGYDPVVVDTVCCRIMGYDHHFIRAVSKQSTVRNHPIGTSNPNRVCVVGVELNKETFGASFLPHCNYNDSKISPYSLNLTRFDVLSSLKSISIRPERPKEDNPAQIVAEVSEAESLSSAWLRLDIDGGMFLLLMSRQGESLLGSIPRTRSGVQIRYSICLMDALFNTHWSEEKVVVVQ